VKVNSLQYSNLVLDTGNLTNQQIYVDGCANQPGCYTDIQLADSSEPCILNVCFQASATK